MKDPPTHFRLANWCPGIRRGGTRSADIETVGCQWNRRHLGRTKDHLLVSRLLQQNTFSFLQQAQGVVTRVASTVKSICNNRICLLLKTRLPFCTQNQRSRALKEDSQMISADQNMVPFMHKRCNECDYLLKLYNAVELDTTPPYKLTRRMQNIGGVSKHCTTALTLMQMSSYGNMSKQKKNFCNTQKIESPAQRAALE